MKPILLLPVLISAGALGDSASAPPQAGDPAAPPSSSATSTSQASMEVASVPESNSEAIRHFGALLDAGAPDGIGVSVVYSPIYFVRVHGGVSTLFVATALRLGATLVPFQHWVNPTFSADFGHFFSSNLNSFVGSDAFAKALTKSISGDYFNLLLGVEFGTPQKFQFYVRGGVSFASASSDNFGTAIRQTRNNPNLDAANPTVHIIIPSAKLGFVWFFL